MLTSPYALFFRQYQATVRGAMKGSAAGLAASAPTAYLLHRSWAPFRGLSLPIKAFFVTSATIMTGIIAADKSGIAYDVSCASFLF